MGVSSSGAYGTDCSFMSIKPERMESNPKLCLSLVFVAAIKYSNKSNLGKKGFLSAQFQVMVCHSGEVTAAEAEEAGHITASGGNRKQCLHARLCSAFSFIQPKAQSVGNGATHVQGRPSLLN